MKISIPAPCDQKWEEMTPKGMNRHCQLCQKEIVDFTHFSDAALTRYIEANPGRVCGRFVSDQLNRELVYQAPKKSFFSLISQKWLAFWLFATAPIHLLKAQVKTEISPDTTNAVADTTTFFISGRVVDSLNQPVSFVKIKIIEIGISAISDNEGNFKFVFTDNVKKSYSVKIWGSNMKDSIIVNGINPNTSDVKITIPEDQFYIETMIVGLIVVKPEIIEPEQNSDEPIQWRRRKKRTKN